jgi:hypothetical protein
MRIIQFPTDYFWGPISALHFAPDGLTLVAVVRAGSWIVYPLCWDLQGWAPAELDRGGGAEEDAGFAPDPVLSPDHRLVAYVYIERGPEYSLRLFDRSEPKNSKHRERRLTTRGGRGDQFQEYLALQFSPDGRFLVAALTNPGEHLDDLGPGEFGIYRWNVESILKGSGRKSKGRFLPDSAVLPMPVPDVSGTEELGEGLGRTLAFSPDGSSLAAGLWNAGVLRWGFPSGAELPAPRSKARPEPRAWRLAPSPDGRTLAVADKSVILYDVLTAAPRVTLPHPRSRSVLDLAFDPSGGVLATACGDRSVRWWDGTTGTARETFDWKIGRVTAVAFSTDGCLCAAAGEKGRIAVWDVSA